LDVSYALFRAARNTLCAPKPPGAFLSFSFSSPSHQETRFGGNVYPFLFFLAFRRRLMPAGSAVFGLFVQNAFFLGRRFPDLFAFPGPLGPLVTGGSDPLAPAFFFFFCCSFPSFPVPVRAFQKARWSPPLPPSAGVSFLSSLLQRGPLFCHGLGHRWCYQARTPFPFSYRPTQPERRGKVYRARLRR